MIVNGYWFLGGNIQSFNKWSPFNEQEDEYEERTFILIIIAFIEFLSIPVGFKGNL